MIRLSFHISLILLTTFLMVRPPQSIGQIRAISLEEALDIARTHDAGLQRDQLAVDRQSVMAEAGLSAQATQIFFTGEEFGLNGQSGIHSFNVQQNFYLPKAGRAQRNYYQKGAELAEKQFELTDLELRRQLAQAYYQLLYARQEKDLQSENIELFEDFLAFTTAQLTAGETGKIPQLSARSRLGQARLEEKAAISNYQMALNRFNLWLQSDSLYDARGELDILTGHAPDSVLQSNPHLQLIQAKEALADAGIETQKAKLLPQINSGARLQTMGGNFPLFGYQLGINVPLFTRGYHKRIEAAEIGRKVQTADRKAKEQELSRIITELSSRLEHQLEVLDYLRQDLRPLTREQSEIKRAAYREGEISYLEYLDGLEQELKVKHQYLFALYTVHALRTELEYWSGK